MKEIIDIQLENVIKIAEQNKCKIIAHEVKPEIKDGIYSVCSTYYFDKPIIKEI